MALMFIAKAPPRRRFVDQPSGNESWQEMHRVADKHYPAILSLFEDVFGDTKQEIPHAEIVRLINAGNEAALATLLSSVWQDVGEARIQAELPGIISQIVDESTQAMIPFTEEALAPVVEGEISIAFNSANPHTLAYIDQFVADEVRDVGNVTRQSIRDIVRSGFEESRTIPQMARDIRQFVGLTSKQHGAVLRYRQGLVEAGLKQDRINDLVQRRTARMLRQRTLNIARTESITAANAGQQEVWREARRQGLWNDARMRRFWLTTPDDRLCSVCLQIPGMNPDGVRLDEPFQTPVGPRDYPTVHVL